MYQKNKKAETVSSYYSFPWKPLHLREERKQRDLKAKSRCEAIILKTDRRAQKHSNTNIKKLKQGTCLAPHTWNLNWINCHRTSFDFDTNQILLACLQLQWRRRRKPEEAEEERRRRWKCRGRRPPSLLPPFPPITTSLCCLHKRTVLDSSSMGTRYSSKTVASDSHNVSICVLLR